MDSSQKNQKVLKVQMGRDSKLPQDQQRRENESGRKRTDAAKSKLDWRINSSSTAHKKGMRPAMNAGGSGWRLHEDVGRAGRDLEGIQGLI